MRTSNNKNKHIDSSSGDALEGRYANYFKVGHNAYEFIIDFGQYYSENDRAELYSRIITSPVYAKAFLKTLKKSIETFEKSFGSILEDKG